MAFTSKSVVSAPAMPAGAGASKLGRPLAPVFYPAVCVNMRIRFDETFLVDSRALQPALTPDDKIKQKLDTAVGSTGSDNLSQIYNIVPKNGTAVLPGYRQAGHFSLHFAWQDIPIDPRAIRAMAVDVYLATVDPKNYAAGMVQQGTGVRPSLFQPNGLFGFANEDNLLITGPVDEINTDFDDSGATLVLDGRDDRGILLDSPITAEALAALDLTLPIDQFVQAVCNTHPRQGIDPNSGRLWFYVEPANPNEWPNGRVPSPATTDDVTKFRVSVQNGKPMQTPMGPPEKLNFWDVITNYCYLVGAIPYFTGRTIKVRPSRSLFDLVSAGKSGSKFPSPFAGGKPRTVDGDAGPESFSVRRLVYGRDVSKLSLARKCGGVQTPVVTVVSFDSSSKAGGKGKLIKVTYPSKDTVSPSASAALSSMASKVSAAQAKGKGASALKQAKGFDSAKRTAVSPAGSGESELQEIRISIPGISSKAKLTEIARSLYEEIGRQEIGGSCETKFLASLGGDNADPDLLRIRPGDAVQLLVDARALSSKLPGVAPLMDLQRMGFADAVREIKIRLGLKDDNLARALVASMQNATQQFSTYFRVANVRMTFGSKLINVAFDFQNYIEARSELDTTPGGP